MNVPPSETLDPGMETRGLRPPSLPGSHRSVRVPIGGAWWKRGLAFLGPGFLVAVGYIDPGNWATDLAGGSAFGYSLLWVILASNVMAVLLQSLCCRLGIATGRDLAQACRDNYPRPVAFVLWIFAELAICATDLAEVIGTAIALKLLFGIPLDVGVVITALDVFLLLALQGRRFRTLERVVLALIVAVLVCIGTVLGMSGPHWGEVARGFVPSSGILHDPLMLYVAVGILGATVMPHNLYLHSSVVQTRRYASTPAGKESALRFANVDTVLALTLAFMINAAILITCSSAFHANGHFAVASLEEAHHLLTPVLGSAAASTLFGLALLAAGQSSAVTTTLAGQIVMEGFTEMRLPTWARRLVTRTLAIIPALAVTWLYGESQTARLLVFSQVILSLQLPFAVLPLLQFTADKRRMGRLANPRWLNVLAGFTALTIVAAGIALVAT